jgi:hypothetical protein
MLYPVAIFGPPLYYSLWMHDLKPVLDIHEHYIKQTLRSRYRIATANGIQTLSVPVNRKNHQAVKDIKIDRTKFNISQHRNALDTAYNKSPYYEYFTDDLHDILVKSDGIMDIQIHFMQWLSKLFPLSQPSLFSEQFTAYGPKHADLRVYFTESESEGTPLPYYQVFQDRHGFLPGCSILDVLFNLGTETHSYLKDLYQTVIQGNLFIFGHHE